jgi:hypothetical protein
MDNQEKIINFIKQKGPCLPSDIYRELGTNQLFASAMLGELVSLSHLKVTYLKRGTSPYYYLEEQKEKLQSIFHFLNEKDQLAYNLIKEKLILKDSEQSPLMRVALRTIKDYAVPIQINYKGEIILFWRWYLLSKEETETQLKLFLGIKPEPTKELEKPREEKNIKEKIESKIQEKTIIKQEKHIIKQNIKKENIHAKIISKKEPSKEITSDFLNQLKQYFDHNKINVLEQEIKNRTKTEIDLVLEIPSAFGILQYYCKAKNKKKINDSDIASAMIQGQQKKLPILVLITGDMTKKTKEMLEKEFKGVKVHKI